jgi:hypothetical protein
MMSTKFSYFTAPVRNTKPKSAITLTEVYNLLTSEYYRERTERLRAITDIKEARKFKADNFDYCTFSGVFSSRKDAALIQHSNLLCLDFDHLEDVDGTKQKLLHDEYFDTLLLFRSPSGHGLKWIVPIDASECPQGIWFQAIENYVQITYQLEIDKACKDVSRACFLCYDPETFINI